MATENQPAGTAELADGAFVKASDVKFIEVKDRPGGHVPGETSGCHVSVIYGAGTEWRSKTLPREEAEDLACEINERVNKACSTTPAIVTKEAKDAKRTPVHK